MAVLVTLVGQEGAVHWSWDDCRIVGDIVLGSLLVQLIRLVALKAFIEPAAVWSGQLLYRGADRALGGRLPNWFTENRPAAPPPSHPSPGVPAPATPKAEGTAAASCASCMACGQQRCSVIAAGRHE